MGRETLDAAIAGGVDVEALLDDRQAGQIVRGLPVHHPEDAPCGAPYVVGIADPAARRRLAELLDVRGMLAPTVRHPRAIVARETTVAAGCVLLANAHVSSSSVVVGGHSQSCCVTPIRGIARRLGSPGARQIAHA